MLAEDVDRGQRLERGHVAAAGHHHVGLAALVVAGPLPDADAGGAVLDGRVHVEPLQRGLLAGDDHVDVVAAAQAVVGHARAACWRRAAGRRGSPRPSCSPRGR